MSLPNHYHLLLETPEGNLSAGMGWLQNGFTRRINVRHRLWGRLFGDRYKERLLRQGGKRFSAKATRTGDGYAGEAMRDHGEMEARRLLQVGLKYFHLTEQGLASLPKGDGRKALIAGLIQERTSIRLDWIAAMLGMGSRSYCCRMVRKARNERDLKRDGIKLRAPLLPPKCQ